MPAPHLPVCLDLDGRRCLVVGADAEAARKAAILERAGASVVRLAVLSSVPVALDGLALVIVSGAPGERAAEISRRCHMRGIPVNVVDDPRLCSFLMPALVERGPVTVAISTGGRSPLLAKLLREAIDRVLPERLGDLAELAGDARPQVRDHIATPAQRLQFWSRMLTGTVAKLALSGRKDAARAALASLLAAASERRRVA
jgi:uroporphyrin-III C-methyltransferase/precorrin-2 dehydrogenase/sirohydrochlorin ferrochelatase